MKKVALILLSVALLLVSCAKQTTVTTEQTDSHTENLTEPTATELEPVTGSTEPTTEPTETQTEPNTDPTPYPDLKEYDSVEEAFEGYQKLYVDCDYKSDNYYVEYEYNYDEYYALIFTDIDDFGVLIYYYEDQHNNRMKVLSFYAYGKVIETETLEDGDFDMIHFFGKYIHPYDNYILYNGGYGVNGHYGYKYFLIMHPDGYYEITDKDLYNHIGVDVGTTVSYENGRWSYQAQNARWHISGQQDLKGWVKYYVSADEFMMEVGTFDFDKGQVVLETEQSYTVGEWFLSEYMWWKQHIDFDYYHNIEDFVADIHTNEVYEHLH